MIYWLALPNKCPRVSTSSGEWKYIYPVYNVVKHDLLNFITFLQFLYNEIFIVVDRFELVNSIYLSCFFQTFILDNNNFYGHVTKR